MKFKYVIGLDMGKETFTLSVYNTPFQYELNNHAKEIRQMLKTLERVLIVSLDDCLFCLEHTGLYSYEMVSQLSKKQLNFALISGLEIKKSLGISRGKSDLIDATKIAEYAYRRQDCLPLYQLPNEVIIKLQHLLSLRAMLVRTRASYLARMKEQQRVLKKTHNSLLFLSQKRLINSHNKEIKKVEDEIAALIKLDEQLSEYHELLTSIKGVGTIVAAQMMVKTNRFTLFANWRKFACYCGTAPFPNESGKMKGPSRISKLGDTKMKTLLTLAARSAILHDPEMKAYYNRKRDQGKTKKHINNAVRNKLLARMFSVIKRGTPYVVLMKYAS